MFCGCTISQGEKGSGWKWQLCWWWQTAKVREERVPTAGLVGREGVSFPGFPKGEIEMEATGKMMATREMPKDEQEGMIQPGRSLWCYACAFDLRRRPSCTWYHARMVHNCYPQAPSVGLSVRHSGCSFQPSPTMSCVLQPYLVHQEQQTAFFYDRISHHYSPTSKLTGNS